MSGLPTPSDEHERTILANVEAHGCHIWSVAGDSDGPGFSYSVGLQRTTGAPELLIYGLPSDVAPALINDYRDRVRAGERFESGRDYDDFLEGYPVRFERVVRTDIVDDEHVRSCVWFYGDADFEVLQLVWPNRDGVWPCDADASDGFRQAQPVLFACACPEERHPALPLEQDDADIATYVCPHVVEGERPALYVVHDEDGDWQFVCGGTDHDDGPRIVGLGCVLEQDPTLREVVDLDVGEEAERDSVGAPWRRSMRPED